MEDFKQDKDFIEFKYTYKSMSYENGKTYIQMYEKSNLNGKLEEKNFEGTIAGDKLKSILKEHESSIVSEISKLFSPFKKLLP